MLDPRTQTQHGFPVDPDSIGVDPALFDAVLPSLHDMQAIWLIGMALMRAEQPAIRHLGTELVATLDFHHHLFQTFPHLPDATKQEMLATALQSYRRNTELLSYLHEHGMSLIHQVAMHQLQPPPEPSAFDEFMEGMFLNQWHKIKELANQKNRNGKNSDTPWWKK